MLAAPAKKPRPAAGEGGQKRILVAPFWGPQGLFESQAVKSLLGSDEDISIVVDTDWRHHHLLSAGRRQPGNGDPEKALPDVLGFKINEGALPFFLLGGAGLYCLMAAA